ncbi:MAG: hypothetical protein KDI73_03415 [Candidatus Competibacteraceae bacterium]|nr:hypothetical protein [Candidatus Competibacteraceae bacterium]HRY14692.1 hypothetical protein [Candidatus Competibacteraceae bacterium]
MLQDLEIMAYDQALRRQTLARSDGHNLSSNQRQEYSMLGDTVTPPRGWRALKKMLTMPRAAPTGRSSATPLFVA